MTYTTKLFCTAVTVAVLATATIARASGTAPAIRVPIASGTILAQTTPPAATSTTPMPSAQPNTANSSAGTGAQPDMREMAGHMHQMGMDMQKMGMRMEQQGQNMQQGGATPSKVDPGKMHTGMERMEMGMKDMDGAMGPGKM